MAPGSSSSRIACPEARPEPLAKRDVREGKASACDACGGMFRRTFKCTRCQVAKYCCKQCQSDHWEKQHKKACKELAKGLPGTGFYFVSDRSILKESVEDEARKAQRIRDEITKSGLLSLLASGYLGIAPPHCMLSPKNTSLDKRSAKRVASWYGTGMELATCLHRAFENGAQLSIGCFGSVWIDLEAKGADGAAYHTRFAVLPVEGTGSGLGLQPDPTGDERLFV